MVIWWGSRAANAIIIINTVFLGSKPLFSIIEIENWGRGIGWQEKVFTNEIKIKYEARRLDQSTYADENIIVPFCCS